MISSNTGKQVTSMDINNDKDLIEKIMNHLDAEVAGGSMCMSVNVHESVSDSEEISHKCCQAYGTPANETIAKLDMYSDSVLPDNAD